MQRSQLAQAWRKGTKMGKGTRGIQKIRVRGSGGGVKKKMRAAGGEGGRRARERGRNKL